MNVLIYNGRGTSRTSLRAAHISLQEILSPYYAISYIGKDDLISAPWASTTALLVVPGGRDVSYCNDLNGAGNYKIEEYVRRGGKYLGLCAGAYYASATVEFERGTEIAVEGSRELKFFKGLARGCAYPGFVYESEAGARVTKIRSLTKELSNLACYWNGGGIFVDAAKTANTRVLAEYLDEENLQVAGGLAAVIHTTVGKGAVILSAIHPEIGSCSFEPGRLPAAHTMLALNHQETQRLQFLRHLMATLGLRTSCVPLHSQLSTLQIATNTELQRQQLIGILTALSCDGVIRAESDKFILITDHTQRPFESSSQLFEEQPKYINTSPEANENSAFALPLYFTTLRSFSATAVFGSQIFYADTVTSSQTMLDKNFLLTKALPNGFTILCSHQLAGRGRGANSWVSPPGVLSFSMILRYKPLRSHEGLVFIQYLISLSVVQAIRKINTNIDVRLKWPNDIYMRVPQESPSASFSMKGIKYSKISGSLITTTYWQNEYIMVVGVGINVSNAYPTVSLNSFIPTEFHIRKELLLAHIMHTFETNFAEFQRTGSFKDFVEAYYSYWLHEGQHITIEASGTKGKITGIDERYGTLEVELIEGPSVGRKVGLQADSNSFDMMRGLLLIKR